MNIFEQIVVVFFKLMALLTLLVALIGAYVGMEGLLASGGTDLGAAAILAWCIPVSLLGAIVYLLTVLVVYLMNKWDLLSEKL